jgi:virginiamycin B lyase
MTRLTVLLAWALALVIALPIAAQTVRYYPVPSGAGPHDVAPAPDGTVWYTAQRTGELGRLDPATGKTEHIALGRGSAPHGVIVGPDGAAWVTDSGLNAIVRCDRAAEKFTSFPSDKSGAHVRQVLGRPGEIWGADSGTDRLVVSITK